MPINWGINKQKQYNHIIKFNSAMKRNELPIHATTCVMFKSIMLVKDTGHKIPQIVGFRIYEISRKGISIWI